MPKTILFDLDSTLLDNRMDSFLPGYLQALSASLADVIPPVRLVPALMDGTKKMLENRQPECTLQDVFECYFYNTLGVEKSRIQPYLDAFYNNEFPKLKRYTHPLPAAVEMVQNALELGYQLVIATSPLFPRTAIEQRLSWADLPVDQYPFSLITSFERFHFAKPNPAFFAEILGQLGWPDGEVLVVGDDFEQDILPSIKLGLPTFWVNSHDDPEKAPSLQPTGIGLQADLIPWLRSRSTDGLTPVMDSPASLLASLRATPAVLHTWARDIAPSRWNKRTQPNAWSPAEIVCHLRDTEREVNLPRVETILKSKNPFIPGMDTDRWADERKYIEQNGPHALYGFMAARTEYLAHLESMTAKEWQLPARHAILGPTTVQELVSIIAVHDRLHIRQMLDELQREL